MDIALNVVARSNDSTAIAGRSKPAKLLPSKGRSMLGETRKASVLISYSPDDLAFADQLDAALKLAVTAERSRLICRVAWNDLRWRGRPR